MLPIFFATYGAVFVAEIVGDKLLYTTGVLATRYRAKAEVPVMLLVASLAGLGFALYLTYVEAFVLAVWCILCLSSLALVATIAVLSSVLVVQKMGEV